MPSVNQAHSDMSLADLIEHQQQPPFSFSAPMETDEPTQPYFAYVPRNEGGAENSFAVPPIAKISQGPGPSAPAASAPSGGHKSSQAPTQTYSAAPSSSASRGAGQSKPAPSRSFPLEEHEPRFRIWKRMTWRWHPSERRASAQYLPGQKAQTQWDIITWRSTTQKAPTASRQMPSFLA